MIPERELRQMYCDEKMSQIEIAKVVGVSQITISRIMKAYDIQPRTHSEAKIGNSIKPSEMDLKKMYYDDQMSQREIADKIGVTQRSILNWMKIYRIESRMISEAKLGNLVKLSKEELEEMYRVNQMSSIEIANKIGVGQSTILRWMQLYEIESRTHSDFVGKNASNWQGGISFEPYCEKFNNEFKEAVRERDNYMCQLCDYEQNGRKLDVHHIHYDKSNCWPDVVALCRSCHAKTVRNRDYWEQYFENQLSERGLTCWSIIQET